MRCRDHGALVSPPGTNTNCIYPTEPLFEDAKSCIRDVVTISHSAARRSKARSSPPALPGRCSGPRPDGVAQSAHYWRALMIAAICKEFDKIFLREEKRKRSQGGAGGGRRYRKNRYPSIDSG